MKIPNASDQTGIVLSGGNIVFIERLINVPNITAKTLEYTSAIPASNNSPFGIKTFKYFKTYQIPSTLRIPIIIPYDTPTIMVFSEIFSPLFKNSEKVHGSFFLASLTLFFKVNAIKDFTPTAIIEIKIKI